jgi:hypothetical protein
VTEFLEEEPVGRLLIPLPAELMGTMVPIRLLAFFLAGGNI